MLVAKMLSEIVFFFFPKKKKKKRFVVRVRFYEYMNKLFKLLETLAIVFENMFIE